MKTDIEYYQQQLVNEIKFSLICTFRDYRSDDVLPKAVFEAALQNLASLKFQKYYMRILKNVEHYKESEHFFKEFKQQYSLQYVDNDYLGRLEENKDAILKGILANAESRAAVYFRYFKEAKLKHGDRLKTSEQGSFFSKLVHTFIPDQYCALDNPIKKFFGLEKETFYSSFLAVSQAYREYAEENPDVLQRLRYLLSKADTNNEIHLETCSDLKILDLVFWVMANKPETLEDEEETENYSHLPDEALEHLQYTINKLIAMKFGKDEIVYIDQAKECLMKHPRLPENDFGLSFTIDDTVYIVDYSAYKIELSSYVRVSHAGGTDHETTFEFIYYPNGTQDTTGEWWQFEEAFNLAFAQQSVNTLNVSEEV